MINSRKAWGVAVATFNGLEAGRMLMTTGDGLLTGLRVLVVEDTLVIADMLCETLVSFGCEVVGPAARVEDALEIGEQCELHGALLDVNLAGDYSFEVAEMLERRGIPFVFLTGYDDSQHMPQALRDAPRMGKPFRTDELKRTIARHFV